MHEQPIRPWTNKEKAPFTTDPVAKLCVDNIYCAAQVTQEKSAEGFIGWAVQGDRPLSVTKEGYLAYGAGGNVFTSYQQAIDASVFTYLYAKEHGYNWFNSQWGVLPYGKHRIFSLVKIQSKGGN